MLSRRMIDQGDLLLLLIRLKCKTALEYVVLMKANTLNVDEEVLRKRMEKSIADHDESHEPMMANEADMDFRIPGLPHSALKHTQSTSVRELIQKIENHPNRHVLQQNLRQNHLIHSVQNQNK